MGLLAEAQPPVFKTGAFDHSAKPPQPAPPNAPGLIRQTPKSTRWRKSFHRGKSPILNR